MFAVVNHILVMWIEVLFGWLNIFMVHQWSQCQLQHEACLILLVGEFYLDEILKMAKTNM